MAIVLESLTQVKHFTKDGKDYLAKEDLVKDSIHYYKECYVGEVEGKKFIIKEYEPVVLVAIADTDNVILDSVEVLSKYPI